MTFPKTAITYKQGGWFKVRCTCGALCSSRKPIMEPWCCPQSWPEKVEWPEKPKGWTPPPHRDTAAYFHAKEYDERAIAEGYEDGLEKMWATEVAEMTDDEKQDWGIPTG